MAMSKEDQKAASDRIMAKEPLTPEEQEVYEMLSKLPEDYRPPKENRECGHCGAQFEDTTDRSGKVLVSALEKFSDHQTEHNPTPGQCATAHERIRAGKEQSKAT